jgi:hypothetical protein
MCEDWCQEEHVGQIVMNLCVITVCCNRWKELLYLELFKISVLF